MKDLWLAIGRATRGDENEIDLVREAELFLAVGYDNPDTVLLRWLRARRWEVQTALELFLDTIQWRQDWGVKEFVAKGERDLCEEEVRTGKSYFMGQDKDGRPINYVSARDHVKDQFTSDDTEKLTVFTMETGRKLLRSPYESVTVVFDMTDFSLKNMDYQHLKFLVHLLQNYYPESFALGLIVNAPWIFNSCWFIIKRWLDPVVHNKIHFVNSFDELAQFIHPDSIPRKLNGNHPDFQYIPATEEDLAMLEAFRNDVEGKRRAEDIHRQAVEKYLKITDRWVREEESREIVEERMKATEELRNAFEQLVPYIHTRTHYHRTGAIDEPMFEILHQRIQENQ